MDTGTRQRRQPKNKGLARAIKQAGGQSALARLINRKQATVWEWLNETGKVSAEDAVAIEKATGVPGDLINGALREFAELRGLQPAKAA